MRNRDVWTETDAASPYTEASRARITLSAECRELAEFARGMVPIYGRAEADLVEDAARLRAQADWVLERAIVAARAAGTSWEDIGAALGVTRQEAHRRYRAAEQRWDDDLAHPEGVQDDGTRYWRLPEAARVPGEVAVELDAWVARHREPHDVQPEAGERPVSDGLVQMGPLEETSDLIGRRRVLMAEHLVPPADQMAAIYDREAVLADRLAAGGVDSALNREAAARARARAAELRAEVAAAGETTKGAES